MTDIQYVKEWLVIEGDIVLDTYPTRNDALKSQTWLQKQGWNPIIKPNDNGEQYDS